MKKLIYCVVLLSAMAFGQGYRFDSMALGPKGPLPNVTVTLCTATATGIPCSPAAQSFTDNTLSTTCASGFPVVVPAATGGCSATSDFGGNYGFWLAPGNAYTYTITGPNIVGQSYKIEVPVGYNSSTNAVNFNGANLANVGAFTTSGTIFMGTSNFPCNATGYNAAITAAAAAAGIINGYGCAPSMTWTSAVVINQPVAIYMPMTTITCTGFAGPCLSFSSPGGGFIGPVPGHPFNSDGGQSTKLVAGTGFTGPLVKQQINAGARNSVLYGVTLDCNNFQAGVTTGVEIGPNQDNRAYYLYGATVGCPSGFITDSTSGTPVRSFTIDHWYTHYVDVPLNFGQASLTGITVTNSKFDFCVNGFILGSDDNIAGNQSAGINLYSVDTTNNNNQALCNGHSGSGNNIVRNVTGFRYDSYWAEDGSGATSTGNAVLQLGTASSTPVSPIATIPYSSCNSNATTNWAVELVSVTEPDITVNSAACTTGAVKNTGQSGGGRIHCFGGATCIDNMTGLNQVIGLVAVQGSNVNRLAAPNGLALGQNTQCIGSLCDFDCGSAGICRVNRSSGNSAQWIFDVGDGTNTTQAVFGLGKKGMQFNELGTEASPAGQCELEGDNVTNRDFVSCNGATAVANVHPGSTDTFTNKTFDTAGAGNSFKINGQSITATTGANATAVVAGADINTSGQVTATHLAAALPVNQGGTGTTSTLSGIVRGGSPVTAAELSGDCTTSGSNAVTCTQLNGTNFTVNPSGVPTKVAGVTTAGEGSPIIQCVTSQKSETGADTNVLTCTPAAAAGSYRLRFIISLSAANTATLGWTATWTDSNGTGQTPTNLPICISSAGTCAATTGALSSTVTASGDYNIDVNSAGTNIVIKLTFSGTSFTGKVTATVERII